MLTLATFAAHGLKHGRHGLRIVGLVVIVAALTWLAIWLWRRHRERGHTGDPGLPPLASSPPEHPPAPPAAEPDGSEATVPGAVPRPGGPIPGKANTIEARGLVKRYGAKTAVDDLSFDVHPGCVTGFLGPNGAGKSTTMRMIVGLDAPDRGTVLVHGRRYHDLDWPLREVGALLEARAVHPGRTARSHLWMLARANGIPARRIDEVLALVGLTEVADQRVGQYSLGMGQRLGIAVALLGDPGVVMFDEPVNGLDTDGIRWVRTLLRQLASEGRAVFVSSHLMSEMSRTADRVVVIGKGRLIAEMGVEEFTARNAQAYVRVRTPQPDELRAALYQAGAAVSDAPDGSLSVRGLARDRVGEVAFRHSVLLHELATESASLEEAFIGSTEGELEFTGPSHDGGSGSPVTGTTGGAGRVRP